MLGLHNQRTIAYSLIGAKITALLLLSSSFGSRVKASSDKSPFTTQDSIEMSYIVDPARFTDIGTRERQPVGFPIYSPDNKYFLLITQRGVLASNTIEGTIWCFDVGTIRMSMESTPKKLASVRAISNTPVIEDVRWIDGSRKIAFLAKDRSPYERLFVADVETGAVHAVTGDGSYVTAYDMHGDTVVYTVLAFDKGPPVFKGPLVGVGESSIYDLLYRSPPAEKDLGESLRARLPSSLHIQREGKEVPIHFRLGNRPLRLFVPILVLSPDSASLITVAPVYRIPKAWDQYMPSDPVFRFPSGPVLESRVMSADEVWRPEQYVLVNLKSGVVSPLVDAPAGRDMGYSAPTGAFWFADNSHVIVSNTYLPLNDTGDQQDTRRSNDPLVASVNVWTKAVQEIADLRSLQGNRATRIRIDRVVWNGEKQTLTIQYKMPAHSSALGPVWETYAKHGGGWVKTQSAITSEGQYSSNQVRLDVREDLNHPPKLWARFPNSTVESLVWDPNPQLKVVQLDEASVYHWRDDKGRNWSGVLALPSDYVPGRSNALVIQTHGYQPDRFFADGYATTASGGRALAAKGVVILQMEDLVLDESTPEENSDQCEGFASAVDQLVADGLVDRRRVGIIGFSRTAQHVLYTLTQRPDLFASAMVTSPDFSYVPYVMWSKGFGVNGPQREAEGMNGGAPFGPGLLQWIKNAPGFNLDKTRAPLLIVAFGKGGLISQWETFSMLRRMHKPVDMVWWRREDVPHFVIQPAHRYTAQQLAVDWFDFWLKGHENQDAHKNDQYVRWRRLRKLDNASP